MLTTEDMNKDVTVQVRLTAEEHKRWLTAAEAEERTLSNWIRRQCNAAAADAAVRIALEAPLEQTLSAEDRKRVIDHFGKRGVQPTKKGGK